MIIESQELPPIGTNAFALIEPALKECVIIDAPAEAHEWAVQVAEKHKGGDQLELLATKMEIRHVPGHCPGNVLVYIASEKAAIVGDVIFAGSVGRYDLPGGDFSVLKKSIKTQVYSLPDETTIYPGHGPVTSVGQEKAGNPYVKG